MRELGISATALARKLKLSQPAVSISVKRGEKIAGDKDFDLLLRLEFYNFMDVPLFRSIWVLSFYGVSTVVISLLSLLVSIWSEEGARLWLESGLRRTCG